eukprot:2116287-Amphidinium_carterae.1
MFWLRCLAPESDEEAAEQKFLQSAQPLATIASDSQKASKAAWRLRKWDLYERPADAPKLKDKHPDLLEAAEEVCSLAQKMRSGSLGSVSHLAQQLAALATAGALVG